MREKSSLSPEPQILSLNYSGHLVYLYLARRLIILRRGLNWVCAAHLAISCTSLSQLYHNHVAFHPAEKNTRHMQIRYKNSSRQPLPTAHVSLPSGSKGTVANDGPPTSTGRWQHHHVTPGPAGGRYHVLPRPKR